MNQEISKTPQLEAAEWARLLLDSKDFVILDTETTGLDSTAQIVQIAVTDHEGIPLMDTLICPTVPISPDATRIHGITDEMVMLQESFYTGFLKLLQAVGTKDVVIYNAQYDLRLIQQSLRAFSIHLEFLISERWGRRLFTNGGQIHCAMLWYAQWVGEWNSAHGSYRWQKLPGGDHSALGDCRATLDVIKRMAKSAPADDSRPGPYDDIAF